MEAGTGLRAADTALLVAGTGPPAVGSLRSPLVGNLVHCSHHEEAGMLHVVEVGETLGI